MFIQRWTKNVDRSMFHHSLVKMLVEARIEELNDKWDEFLLRNHFGPTRPQPKISRAMVVNGNIGFRLIRV